MERKRERERVCVCELSVLTLKEARKDPSEDAFATSLLGLIWPQLANDTNGKGKRVRSSLGDREPYRDHSSCPPLMIINYSVETVR